MQELYVGLVLLAVSGAAFLAYHRPPVYGDVIRFPGYICAIVAVVYVVWGLPFLGTWQRFVPGALLAVSLYVVFLYWLSKKVSKQASQDVKPDLD